jgi:hypothetical protein
MTNRERFLRTMRYQEVDHPPIVIPGPWTITRKRWEQEGLPKGMNLYEYFELPPYKLRHVGFETMLYPPFEEKILEKTEEYIIKIDDSGVKVKNFLDESSMPMHLEYPIKGRESLPWLREKLNPDIPERLAPDWLEKAKEMENNNVISLCNGGQYFGFLNERMGTEQLLTTYFDDPAFIHEVNDLQCRCCEKGLNIILPQFQLDLIGYHEDMAYKNASLISPKMFKEFMSPYYARILEITKKYPVDIHYMDTDGNVWELIPLWLEIGINMLAPMEVAAGMDVVALRKEFGRELRMGGGFDKRIMASHNKEDIKKELERIRPVIEDGGYIPGLDHEAPPDIPFENLCYYIDCLKRMFSVK